MIPITDIEDPRLIHNWTGDVRSVAEVEQVFLQSPKRLAALLQAVREFGGGIAADVIFDRAREILGGKPKITTLLSIDEVVRESNDRSNPDLF